MSGKKFFAFRVTDEDGLWGDIRIKESSEAKARAACRKQLQEDEVDPKGLLASVFRLTLLPPELTRQPRPWRA